MRAAAGLAALMLLTLVLMLTVGHENSFGFACFLVFVAAAAALAVLGVRALAQRRRTV